MLDIVVRVRIMVLFLLSVGILLVWFLPTVQPSGSLEYLQIHFLDVGQGDSIFIQTPGGAEVLIDGGSGSVVLRQLAKKMSFFDREIDMVVGTHPDKDHTGGLSGVLERYSVSNILTTEAKGESDSYRAFMQLSQDEGSEIIYARRGQEFLLDASTTLRVLFPEVDPSKMESNASSMVLQLVYGDIKIMLTGDSPKRIEEYLVSTQGERLKSDLLKLGHHGSRTSTSELFLKEVDPEFTVVSAGKDNRYGHPHVEVTDMVFNQDVEMFSTAQEGTITFESDGRKIWLVE